MMDSPFFEVVLGVAILVATAVSAAAGTIPEAEEQFCTVTPVSMSCYSGEEESVATFGVMGMD